MVLGLAVLSLPSLAHAQSATSAKLDESLRELLERGCTGIQPVIVTTKPGYRQSLRDSLAAHGDVVKGEFPALEAIAADVHCQDLLTLAAFESTTAVSFNGPIAGQDLTADAQAVVSALRMTLVAAKAEAIEAQNDLRASEKTAALASAQVNLAERALILANRLTGLTKTAAVLAAQTKLAAAKAVADAAQSAFEAARTNAMGAQAAALNAQNALVEAQDALQAASTGIAVREREGKAARLLKKKFFATMPVRAFSGAHRLGIR